MRNKRQPRVLLFVWGGIGNMVMALPMVEALRAATGGNGLGLVAQKGVMLDLLDRERLGITLALDEPRFRNLAGLGRLVIAIRGFRPDGTISSVAFPRLRYGSLALLSGAPLRICEDTRGTIFCNSPVPTTGRHGAARNLELLSPLGIHGRLSHGQPVFPLPIRSVFADSDDTGRRPLAGLFPGAGHPLKRWPSGRFITLGKELTRRHQVIVFAGPDEPGLGMAVADGIGNGAREYMGPLRDVLSLITRCQLFIGNDTGLSHCAAALGVPTIALFGPADPGVTGPVGERVVCIRSGEPCAPCYRGGGRYRCRYKARGCMEAITVEQVLDAVCKIRPGSS